LRVRSYLDANCAQCHRPGGAEAFFDARFDTPPGKQDLINGPVENPIGIPGARIIVPGDISKSVLFHRISITGSLQMPPLARNLNDSNAVTAVAAWINSLPHAASSLPPNWLHTDIGSVGFSGDASYLNGRFNLIASGVDIWESVDGFQYAYKPLTGDGQIVAHVISMQFTDPWAKAGVMFRESLAPGSKHALMIVTAGGGSAFQWRPTANSPSRNTDGPSTTVPYWVRLTRAGDTFTGEVSADGKDWHRVDNIAVPMSKTIYVGLAVTAHNNSELNSVLFDNVAVAQ
jgi:regulation of enolase protein 1 (concanavalin A-like superfamily)